MVENLSLRPFLFTWGNFWGHNLGLKKSVNFNYVGTNFMVLKICLKFKNFQPHIMANLIPWERGKNLPHEQVFKKIYEKSFSTSTFWKFFKNLTWMIKNKISLLVILQVTFQIFYFYPIFSLICQNMIWKLHLKLGWD